MTDPDPPVLSEDELTKILVTVSKTQLEGIKTLQADTNKYFPGQFEKFSQALAKSSAESDTLDRPSKVFQTQLFLQDSYLRISTPGLNSSGR